MSPLLTRETLKQVPVYPEQSKYIVNDKGQVFFDPKALYHAHLTVVIAN